MSKVLSFVNETKPDLATFQELDANLLALLEPGMGNHLKRAGLALNESLPAKDGCGVYFNPERFDFISSKTVRFCNVTEKHIPSLTGAAREESSALSLTRALERELREKLNLVVMVRLRDRIVDREIVACSSHLYWDPSYPDIKLLQAYLLAKEVLEFAGKDIPIVIGADLNSVPATSGVYHLLMGSGSVGTSHPDHPVALRSNHTNKLLKGVSPEAVGDLVLPVPFRSAMKEFFEHEPSFTNYTAKFKGCLDYVMMRGLHVTHASPLPSEAELSLETALPNSKLPSDHLPLTVDLVAS